MDKPVPTSSAQKAEAEKYMEQVKARLQSEHPELYQRFLEGTARAEEGASQEELYSQLPPQAKSGMASDAVAYANTVKERLQSTRPELYRRYLQVFLDYNREAGHGEAKEELISRCHTEWKNIFKDDPDLLEGVEKFFPSSYDKETMTMKYEKKVEEAGPTQS